MYSLIIFCQYDETFDGMSNLKSTKYKNPNEMKQKN